MSRPARSRWVVLAGVVMGLAGSVAPVRAGEDSRTALAFVRGAERTRPARPGARVPQRAAA